MRPDALALSRPTWIDDRRYLIRYDGDDSWHERLILRRVSGQEFVIATPEHDVYVEALATEPDLVYEAAYLQPVGGGRPTSIPRGDPLHTFAKVPSPVQRANLIESAESIADGIKTVLMHRSKVLGIHYGRAPPAAATLPVKAPHVPAGAAPNRPPHRVNQKSPPIDDSQVWVAAVDAVGFARGDIVSADDGRLPPASVTLDDHGLTRDGDRKPMLIQRISRDKLDEFRKTQFPGAGGDRREDSPDRFSIATPQGWPSEQGGPSHGRACPASPLHSHRETLATLDRCQ